MVWLIFTEDEVRHCPLCNSTSFARDYVREETYCTSCGLVITSAVQYVGLEKVENIVPFSAPSEARRGIHTRYNRTVRNPKRYRHNIPNKRLMVKGHN